MYQVSDFTKNMYRVHEVAEILGVTTKTVRNYDKDGKLKTCRTEGNHRMVTRENLIAFLDSKGLIVNVRKQLSLSERVYQFKECGLEIDRDYNASINLSRYDKDWKKIVYTH